MADEITPPEGFVLDDNNIPPPPPGFELDSPEALGGALTPEPEPQVDPLTQEEEDLHTLTRSIMGSSGSGFVGITQPERVRTVIEVNQQLDRLDPLDKSRELERESLVKLRDATLKAYKRESDKALRLRAVEALTEDLPNFVGKTAQFGTELGKDALVIGAAAKGAGAGAALGSVVATPFPPAALVTVPAGALIGGLSSGAVANAVLDPIQDIIAREDEEGESFVGNLANGGLNAALGGLFSAPFKAVSLIRRLPSRTRDDVGRAMVDVLTGSTGRTIQKTRANTANLKEHAIRLMDDGYLIGLEGWRNGRRLPKPLIEKFDNLLVGADDDIARWAKDVVTKADSTDASLIEVHKAMQTVHSLQLHQTFKNPKLNGIKVDIDFDTLIKDLAKDQRVGAVGNTVKNEIKRIQKEFLKTAQDPAAAQLWKIKTAANRKFQTDARQSAKSVANEAVSKAFDDAINKALGGVDDVLVQQLRNANLTSGAYREFGRSVRDVGAVDLATTMRQKAFSLNKSGETFGATLLGAKLGAATGSIAGAGVGVGQVLEEGGDLVSFDSARTVAESAAIGGFAGGTLGGGSFGTSTALQQTLSARMARAKTLNLARNAVGAVSKKLPAMDAMGRMARSVDAIRNDQAAYTMFITVLEQMAGEEVAQNFENMSDEDQKRFVGDVASVLPQFFQAPAINGMNSLIDDVILDPAERIFATGKLREEWKQGLISPGDYQQQVSAINLNGKIVTPKSMQVAAQQLEEPSKPIKVTDDVSRKSTSESDAAKPG